MNKIYFKKIYIYIFITRTKFIEINLDKYYIFIIFY